MIIKGREEKKTKRRNDSDCNLNMGEKTKNFAITPLLFKVCCLSICAHLFFSSSPYQYMHIHVSISSMYMGFFLLLLL